MKKQYPQTQQIEDDSILLSSYIDDTLSPNERHALEQRLATDDILRAELDELQTTVQFLRDMPAVVLPRSFTIDVAAHTPARRFWQHGWLRLGMGMGAALLVLITLAALPYTFFATSQKGNINVANGVATIDHDYAGASRPAQSIAMAPSVTEEDVVTPKSIAKTSDTRALSKTSSQKIVENTVASERNADADADADMVMMADEADEADEAESMPMTQEYDSAITITTTQVAKVEIAAMLLEASPIANAVQPLPTIQPVLAQVMETSAIQQQQAVRLRLLIIILVLIILIIVVAVLFIKHTHRKEI